MMVFSATRHGACAHLFQEREENMSKIGFTVVAGLALAATATARPLYNGPGGTIPDLGSGSSVINVGDNFTVSGVSLSFTGLNHTWVGDLIFTLSHGATTFTFMDRPGVPAGAVGNSDNFISANSYGWADGGVAFPELSAGGTIPSGTYAPGQGPGGVGATFASAFAGQNSSGAWTFTVTDNAGGDIGGWSGWTLNLVPTPGATALLGLAGLAGLRRRR